MLTLDYLFLPLRLFLFVLVLWLFVLVLFFFFFCLGAGVFWLVVFLIWFSHLISCILRYINYTP